MTADEACATLHGVGLNVSLKGATQKNSGAVVEIQQPSSGDVCPVGSVVNIEMRSHDVD